MSDEFNEMVERHAPAMEDEGLRIFLVDELSLRCGDKGTCTIEHGGVSFTVLKNTNPKPKKQGRGGNQSPALT